MATSQIVDNFSNSIVDTIQSVYLAPSDKGVVVEAFTATNNAAINASYKAYIVSPGGDLAPIKPFTIVVWGTLDLGVGIVNQIIPAGGELMIESSAINSIYFTVTGRLVELPS